MSPDSADSAAVGADDALLDMLGCAGRTPSADELGSVLAAWRREVHADSIRELIDTATALAVISAARRRGRRRHPVAGPIAAAAAMLMIAFSAVGLVARSAQPGDRLWGVTRVLYPDYTRSVAAAVSARAGLSEAAAALREGEPQRARASLDRVTQQLPAIAEADGHAELAARHHELQRQPGC